MSGCDCSREELFELSEGMLEGERARQLRSHLRECSQCKEEYLRELRLNGSLSSSLRSSTSSGSGGLLRSVAMSLPTRSRRGRMLWGAAGALLLVAALGALVAQGTFVVEPFMAATGTCHAFVMESADVAKLVLSVSGSLALPLLAAVVAINVLLAGVAYTVLRNRV